MNKHELEYRIRNEGINGLTIKRRGMREKTDEPLLDVPEQKDDLRLYTSMGVIMPVEDYWISGTGREPLAVREVQTSVSGMKKYALLKERCIKPDKTKRKLKWGKKSEPNGMEDIANYSVMYVYSEGIDFKKMAEDEAYAEAVISLLQEERLKQKQAQSEQLGSKTIYLGTIAQADEGYIKAGIRDYATAVKMIDADIKKREEETEKRIEKRLKAEQREEKEKEIRAFIADLDTDEDRTTVLLAILESDGVAKTAEMFKEALEKIKNPKLTHQKGLTPDDDEWTIY